MGEKFRISGFCRKHVTDPVLVAYQLQFPRNHQKIVGFLIILRKIEVN